MAHATLPTITGLAAKIESATQKAKEEIAKTIDKDVFFASCVAQLKPSYTLVYVDYRDQFQPETIAEFINSRDPSILDEKIEEWRMDCMYDAAQSIIVDTFSEDERAAIDLLDLNDELRYAIEERDDSEPIAQMLNNSDKHFCYVPILDGEPYDDESVVIECTKYTDDKEAQLQKIATASGLDIVADRAAIVELYDNGATGAMAPLVWLFAIDPCDHYGALMAQYKSGKDDIMVTLHSPALCIRESWNGQGWIVDTDRTVTVPLSSIRSDEKGNGYSFGNDTCGLIQSAYECGFTFEA